MQGEGPAKYEKPRILRGFFYPDLFKLLFSRALRF